MSMDTGIRTARHQDIPELIKLWNICFHDSEDYIRFFYRENFDHLTAAVYTVDDRPVSMLHWMDSGLVDGSEHQNAKFLYAGGTHPEHRGKGYYAALFRYATDLADRDGFALFGKPASRDLIPYYQTLGFETNAFFRLVTATPGEVVPISISPLAPEEYNRMRNSVFSCRPYAKWPDRHLRWCASENEWFGGGAFAVEMDGKRHFLLGAPEGDVFVIKETDLSLPQLKIASGALCRRFGTDFLKAYLPDFCCGEGEEIVSSIVYNAAIPNTYVNLILN